MTIRAGGSLVVPSSNRPAMHTLFVKFHGLGEGNLMTGQKLRITVASTTRIRQGLLGNA